MSFLKNDKLIPTAAPQGSTGQMGLFKSTPKIIKTLLLISWGFHLSLFGFFYFMPNFFGFIPKKTQGTTVVMLKLGKGLEATDATYVKSKNLPDSTIRQQKDAIKNPSKDKKGKEKQSVKADVKPKKKDPPKEVSEKQRVKENAAIAPTPKKDAKQQEMDDAVARMAELKEKRDVPLEAAQVDKEGQGGSTVGSENAENSNNDPILAAYVEEVIKRINMAWVTTPKTLEDGQSLKTKISLYIDEQGQVMNVSYASKSGDASFDASAMSAVERSSPFPAPPAEIKQKIAQGFLIGFNPRSVVSTN